MLSTGLCSKRNVILRWLIALRAHASLARNAGLGLWLEGNPNFGENTEKLRAICPAPECGKEFEFETGEPRLF